MAQQPELLHAAAEAAIRLADILNALALRVALVDTATSDARTVQYVGRLAILVDSAASQVRSLLDTLRNESPEVSAAARRITKTADRLRAGALSQAESARPHSTEMISQAATTTNLPSDATPGDKPVRASKRSKQ